jgi:hypothetical protein
LTQIHVITIRNWTIYYTICILFWDFPKSSINEYSDGWYLEQFGNLGLAMVSYAPNLEIWLCGCPCHPLSRSTWSWEVEVFSIYVTIISTNKEIPCREKRGVMLPFYSTNFEVNIVLAPKTIKEALMFT